MTDDPRSTARARASGAGGHGPRRCRRCGAFLSATNLERLCYPCQRATFDARTFARFSTRGGG